MASEFNPPKRTNTNAYFPLDINFMVSAFMKSLQDRNVKAASETATGSMILNTSIEWNPAFVQFTISCFPCNRCRAISQSNACSIQHVFPQQCLYSIRSFF